MCGIVGVLGRGPVAGQLVDALKRLEYRGYDSAGVATVEHGELGRRRAEGKLRNLEARLNAAPLLGEIGIGHTRWATHGKPTEANAHPHMTDEVSVVHNGIIENFRELKEELVAGGAAFTSDTDTEVIAHLITRDIRAGNDPVQCQPLFHRIVDGAESLFALLQGLVRLSNGTQRDGAQHHKDKQSGKQRHNGDHSRFQQQRAQGTGDLYGRNGNAGIVYVMATPNRGKIQRIDLLGDDGPLAVQDAPSLGNTRNAAPFEQFGQPDLLELPHGGIGHHQ